MSTIPHTAGDEAGRDRRAAAGTVIPDRTPPELCTPPRGIRRANVPVRSRPVPGVRRGAARPPVLNGLRAEAN